VRVRVGEVIGLLGDTGVKHSAPHLHFTISVRPSAQVPEQYIDPEPLIALWPMRVEVPGTSAGMVTASGETGVPLGSAGRKKKKKALPDVAAEDGRTAEADSATVE
jgi:hypothetical protein